MDQNLFQEINEQSKLLKELCDSLGMKKEDIPQEILDEIWGGPRAAAAFDDDNAPRARAAERDWVSDLAQQQAKKKEYAPQSGGPREMPQQQMPQVGDFVKVGNQLVKVSDVKEQFGNMFVYHTPGQKPIMVDHLKLDKEVGGKRIFVPTV